MPTHEWTVRGSAADAGLIAAVLVDVHRCSMGAWAGMLPARIRAMVSSMKVMSEFFDDVGSGYKWQTNGRWVDTWGGGQSGGERVESKEARGVGEMMNPSTERTST